MTDDEAVEAYQRASEEMQERDAIIEECARAVEACPNGISERIEEAADRVRSLKSWPRLEKKHTRVARSAAAATLLGRAAGFLYQDSPAEGSDYATLYDEICEWLSQYRAGQTVDVTERWHLGPDGEVDYHDVVLTSDPAVVKAVLASARPPLSPEEYAELETRLLAGQTGSVEPK